MSLGSERPHGGAARPGDDRFGPAVPARGGEVVE